MKSVETTPNPNSMKLNLDVHLGSAVTYTDKNKSSAPDFVKELLEIAELQSVFVCHDFITLNKDPRADWPPILTRADGILSGSASSSVLDVQAQRERGEHEGQAHVFVQTFQAVPIQVKVTDDGGETRVSLGQVFNDTAQAIQELTGADFLKERYWADHGVRYGTRDEVAGEVAEELRALFSPAVLERLKTKTSKEAAEKPERATIAQVEEWLASQDWQSRMMAVQELSLMDPHTALDSLIRALSDSKPQIRRLAAAALGTTGSALAVDPLCRTLLNDDSIGVRRTAGDALSDLGDVSAQPAMCEALKDKSKIVRWRAARFLSDLGTAEALPFLLAAADDPEFEVQLEVRSAIERINAGSDATLPAWKRIIEQK